MFHLYWFLSALFILSLAAGAGVAAGQGRYGILVDARGRFSLNRLQLVAWTLVILSAYIAVCCFGIYEKGIGRVLDIPLIPPHLLGLLGISVASAVVAGAVKASKDADPNAVIPKSVAPQNAAAGGRLRRFWQVFLEEEGASADKVVSVTKFQNFLFTCVLLVLFLVLTLQLKGSKLPEFDSNNILWLLGISHAGYVTGKIPAKT